VGDVLETGLPHPDSAVQFAWLSLDEADNDPARFLAYCVAALQPIQPGLGLDTVADLTPGSASPASSMALITALINKMVAISSPYIFVFEDYHVVENQLIHDSLSFLIDNLPARALLVITSRTRPPLPLARLRGRGQLVELGSADLRFAPDEVAPFLNRVMGLDLSNDDVAVLEARTEGWVAGLQMAALSMQGLKDVTGFVNAFGGSHHHVMEYLLQEVLDRQPERIKRFLLETSILNRLSGPLCEAVVSSGPFADPAGSKLETRDSGGHRHGGDFLKQLEQANLFVMPLDEARQWYRYHPLFADLLRHRLEQIAGPQHLTGLHRRASDWYEQHDLAGEAMSHALAAMDMERIIRLAKQKVASMLSRSELVTVLSWLDSLPQDLAQTPSRFPLVQAWAMALMGQLQAVECCIARHWPTCLPITYSCVGWSCKVWDRLTAGVVMW
jgi:LuxR family maltose regulon positive regulatory protein